MQLKGWRYVTHTYTRTLHTRLEMQLKGWRYVTHTYTRTLHTRLEMQLKGWRYVTHTYTRTLHTRLETRLWWEGWRYVHIHTHTAYKAYIQAAVVGGGGHIHTLHTRFETRCGGRGWRYTHTHTRQDCGGGGRFPKLARKRLWQCGQHCLTISSIQTGFLG